MELSAAFLTHIRSIGYTGTLSESDITQVCQGVMKPILQFLMSHTVDAKTSVIVKGNLAMHETAPAKPTPQPRARHLKELLNKAISNHLKLKNLKEKVNQKVSSKLILQTYQSKIESLKDKIKEFRTSLRKLKKNEKRSIDTSSTDRVAESLLYIYNENKSFDFQPNTIEGLKNTFGANLSPIDLLPILTQSCLTFKEELLEKIKYFNPESEFLSLGVCLIKKNDIFEVQDIDNDAVIDKFQKDVDWKREEIWMEFQQTEEVLDKIAELKDKLTGVCRSQRFASEKLKEFCLSEINQQAKMAEFRALTQGLSELQERLSEKEGQSQLSKQQKTAKTESIVSRITVQMVKHSQIRREILKKKLQVDEFIKHHLLNLRHTLPETIKPINTGVSRELKEFLKIADILIPMNIPNLEFGKEEFIEDVFKRQRLSAKVLKICEIMDSPVFVQPETVLKSVKTWKARADELGKEIQVDWLSFKGKKIIRKDLNVGIEILQKCINERKKDIMVLEEEIEIWKAQPAQYLVPWRKDHCGLNIAEALELWKSSL